jgi:S-phase kinase-associated protein 1
MYSLDLGMDQLDTGEALADPIPLANVNGTILRKVIEWCQQHRDDVPVTDDTDDDGNEHRTDDIPSWV